MLKLTLLQMRTHFRRTLAVVIAIVLGVAFFSASMMSGTVIQESIRGVVGNQLRGSDLIVLSEVRSVEPSLERTIGDIVGVRETELLVTEYGEVAIGGASVLLQVGPLSALPEIVNQMPIESGRLPKDPGEIVLTEGAISSTGVDIGDTISWTPFSSFSEGPDGASASLIVVGIISGGNAFGTNLTEAFITPSQFAEIVPNPIVNGIVVQVEENADLDSVQQHVASELPSEVSVLTFDELVDAEIASLEQGSNALSYGLIGFSLISLLVAGIVISNTFAMTIAQRTSELAMFRCIGADRNQIHRSVMIEAGILGAISSLFGVVLGYLAVNAVAAFFASTRLLTIDNVQAGSVLLPVVIGIAVTLLSALPPAQYATSVHPIEALRQADIPPDNGRAGKARVVIAASMVAGGGAVMIGAMLLSLSMKQASSFMPLLIGMVGGAISFLGLVLASSILVPPCITLIGHLLSRLLGVPAKIAASNATRNRRRTAATASALMMGVTLISMMTVGAATTQATWNDVIAAQAPVDLEVHLQDSGEEHELSQDVLDFVGSVDGVDNVIPVWKQEVNLIPAGGGDGTRVMAVGVDPVEGRETARASEAFESFESGQVLVPELLAADEGLVNGDSVTVERDGAPLNLTVKVINLATFDIYMTSADVAKLAPNAPANGAWIRLRDDVSAKDVVSSIADGLPSENPVAIEGSASERETYLDLVDRVLLIATALLGVAVVIAVVGVGNTLTLSVLERIRESGMLRAMGLTSAQLRGTLAIEGVMISLVGGVIGLIAGTAYGWIGTITLFGSNWQVTPAFPASRMVLILAVTVLAGVLASVLPGRRAASVSPVEALAVV